VPKIKVLPDSVASKIAAGEVVERPASLLKELIENSLDAGASRVDVEALGAGKTSLRVRDDGVGMDKDDLELALGRHATSKIGKIEDLLSLKTFGFRGEALYAIAAVSKLSMTSAVRGAKSGWTVSAEAGKVKKAQPAPSVPGTTIETKDLFFNTPARLKFLKSDTFEKSRLVAAVEEAALANPEVRFTYKSEGRQVLSFEPSDAVSRARAVLGAELADDLLEVTADRPGFKMSLFISPSDRLSNTRGFQYWFVNRRPVEARLLQQALYRGYGDHRPKDRHPVCVGHLELSPDAFDVNVHPGKREIRFSKDGDVFSVVSGLVASALAKAKTPAPLTAAPAQASRVAEAVPAHYLGGRSFFPDEPAFQLKSRPAETLVKTPGAPAWFTPPFRFLGQIERSWLVFEADGGIFVLDQHAAAERVLYERYLKQLEDGKPSVQKLMLPLQLELPASAVHKVLSRAKKLEAMGFAVEGFGKTGLNVLSVPALFHGRAEL
jgi:DNA mismatch repair protein MutL